MLLWQLNLEESATSDNGWFDYSSAYATSWGDYSSPTAATWGDYSSATALSWNDGSSATNIDWDSTSTSDAMRWIPFTHLIDPAFGVDFAPKATNYAPYKATSDRPIVLISASTITAAGYAGEGVP